MEKIAIMNIKLLLDKQLQIMHQQLDLIANRSNFKTSEVIKDSSVTAAFSTAEAKSDVVEPRASVIHNSQAIVSRKNKSSSFDFSVYFFGNYPALYRVGKYDLIFEVAKFADANGFLATWIPERHFHAFGGFSPNPSVMCAAIARETKQIKLRPGSVVLPLHNPIRVAEEWAVVDNISDGRVDGMGVAIGWHANDFALNPGAYGNHPEILKQNLKDIKTLWRGDELKVLNGAKQEINIKLFPLPSKPDFSVWFTIVDNPETYAKAAAEGANVLTNLMAQTVEKLQSNIAIYRSELLKNGYPNTYGKVTVLMHTFILDDSEEAVNIARDPFCEYLKVTINLFKSLAKAQGIDFNYDELSEDDINYYLNIVFMKYIKTSALIGNVNTCIPILDKLKSIGVDEIAFFVDFGIDHKSVTRSLPYIKELKDHFSEDNTLSENTKMSAAQEKLWNIAEIEESAELIYHVSVTLTFNEPLDKINLQHAINNLLNNNKILGACFNSQREIRYKKLSVKDVLIERSGVTARGLEELITTEIHTKFDLMNGPLIRFNAINLDTNHSAIIISAEHIIVDGWSLGLLMEEFLDYYNNPVVTPDKYIRTSFQDYQNELQTYNHEFHKNNQYWHNKLKLINEMERISISDLAKNKMSYRANKYKFKLDATMLKELKQVSIKSGCSLFMLMLTIYQILLSKLSNKSQFGVNVVHSGRFIEEKSDFIGFASQVLPLVANVSTTDTVKSLINKVKNELYAAFEHQEYSFTDVCSGLSLEPNYFPCSNYLFNMERSWSGFENNSNVKSIDINPLAYINYDLLLNVVEFNKGLYFDCTYNAEIFSESTIIGYTHAYKTLCEQIIANQDLAIDKLKLVYLDNNEYQKIIYTWNNTYKEYPEDKTIHQLFVEQAKKTPHNIAIVYGDTKLSYKQLDQKSNQLANYLRDTYKVKGDDLIALFLDNSEHMIVAILGVLKSGAAYVPIDPDHPEERIAYILEDTKTKVVLINQHYHKKLRKINKELEILTLDNLKQELGSMAAVKKVITSSTNLAYVIYTSGTTGKPKGVMIEHKSVINFISAIPRVSDVPINAVFTSPYIFDPSIYGIFSNLLRGNILFIIKQECLLSSSDFANYLKLNKIDRFYLPASLLKLHINAIKDIKLKLLLTGVESIENHYLAQLTKIENIIVGYGPTEATVCSTFYFFDTKQSVDPIQIAPLGKPIQNTVTYILDTNLIPLPIGATGELYIGGAGLARGYLGKLELTKEKFIPNPFQTQEDKRLGRNDRLYKTGDMVKYLADGNIQYVGRNDFQVKIRGFRIELGEIENRMFNYPGINQAIVVAREDKDPLGNETNNKYLVGYYVAKDKLNEDDILAYLSEHMPKYMVPSILIYLKQLPLTINGKLDRNALPIPEFTNQTDYVMPRNELEFKLCKIYAEVLRLDENKISIKDDFFKLGGTSIVAMNLIQKINTEFGLQLAVTFLFVTRSIEMQSTKIQQLLDYSGSGYEPILAKVNKSHLERPVIFIHPGHAGAEVYVELMHQLPSVIPCYAIDSYNLHNIDTPLTSIEMMASYYIELLMKAGIKGPYQLVGWSLGGNIAIEMAKQLNALGKLVHHVFLLDSYILNDKEKSLANEISTELMDYTLKHHPVFKLDNNKLKVLTIEHKAHIDYSPKECFESNVTLYKAKNEDITEETVSGKFKQYMDLMQTKPDNGWSEYIAGIKIEQLNQNHYNLLQRDSLIKIINVLIEKWTSHA